MKGRFCTNVPPELAAAVRAWLTKSAHDLKNSEHTLLLPDPECPLDTVCFHAQQCVEKSLKAYLTARQIRFEKTHDLGQLLYLCKADTGLVRELEGVQGLTHYAVELRYVEAVAEEPNRSEAERAVALARKANKTVRKRLKEIL